MECKSTFVLNLFDIKAGNCPPNTFWPLWPVAQRSADSGGGWGFDSQPKLGVRKCDKTTEFQSIIATDFSGFILLWRMFIVLQTLRPLLQVAQRSEYISRWGGSIPSIWKYKICQNTIPVYLKFTPLSTRLLNNVHPVLSGVPPELFFWHFYNSDPSLN